MMMMLLMEMQECKKNNKNERKRCTNYVCAHKEEVDLEMKRMFSNFEKLLFIITYIERAAITNVLLSSEQSRK